MYKYSSFNGIPLFVYRSLTHTEGHSGNRVSGSSTEDGCWCVHSSLYLRRDLLLTSWVVVEHFQDLGLLGSLGAGLRTVCL